MPRRFLLLLFLSACDSAVAVDTTAEGSTGPMGTTTDTSPGTTATGDPTMPDPSVGGDTTGGATSDDDPPDPTCGLFQCEPDVGPIAIECDIFMQDCPEGEKCAPWANDGGASWNAIRCVPVDPDPDGVGEPCTTEEGPFSGLDSCDVGVMCWDVDPDTQQGVCTPLCSGSVNAPMCDDDRICLVGGDTTLPLCMPKCSPLDPEACSEGNGCYPTYDGFICGPDASGKGGGEFEPCEFTNACDSGLMCLVSDTAPALCDPESFGCCIPACDLTDPACPETTTCTPYYEEPVPGLDDVGVCTTPS